MKKILLTLVALVALTWNVNAQEDGPVSKPNDDNYPEGATATDINRLPEDGMQMFLPAGEWFVNMPALIPLTQLPGLAEDLVENPEFFLHLMIALSGKDEFTFTFIPYTHIKFNDGTIEWNRIFANRTDVTIRRSIKKEGMLDVTINYLGAPISLFEFALFFKVRSFINILDVRFPNLDIMLEHETELSRFAWSDFDRKTKDPDVFVYKQTDLRAKRAGEDNRLKLIEKVTIFPATHYKIQSSVDFYSLLWKADSNFKPKK